MDIAEVKPVDDGQRPHIVSIITATGGDYAALIARPLDWNRDWPSGALKLYAWSNGLVTWTTEYPTISATA